MLRALLFSYVANYIYDGDAPLAERRAQALSIDQDQLRELMGDADLRELLDVNAIEETEEQLQCVVETYKARNMDGVHDLLLRLGDLTRAELRLRCVTEEVADTVAKLDAGAAGAGGAGCGGEAVDCSGGCGAVSGCAWGAAAAGVAGGVFGGGSGGDWWIWCAGLRGRMGRLLRMRRRRGLDLAAESVEAVLQGLVQSGQGGGGRVSAGRGSSGVVR